MIGQASRETADFFGWRSEQLFTAHRRAAERRSKNGNWTLPPAVEVSPKSAVYRQTLVLAAGLVALIVAIKVWRAFNGR